jgi:hypothetical protein
MTVFQPAKCSTHNPSLASICSIPRASRFTGERDDPSTPTELKALAAKIVKEENDFYLSRISQ